ncbi:MAG: hypothetical protein LBT47_12535 [Deltaproteobacteria bacterium]|jgi:predicted Fe-Mo cluster-binding NifX family protein|nr:hypothetical protein [Deltaproteobacteria bacterium]
MAENNKNPVSNQSPPGVSKANPTPGSGTPRLRPVRGPYRPQKLAVATETGENIDACFGRTDNFRIYRLNLTDGPPHYELEEIRPGPKPCRDKTHDLEMLDRTAELLSDCGMVLAGRIGPAAVKALSDRGVLGLSAALSIDEALKRLAGK